MHARGVDAPARCPGTPLGDEGTMGVGAPGIAIIGVHGRWNRAR
ncbi:hypothetical protein Pd630_LPD09171 (plasmid) [Rhodococcus opacus PD630]|nr:hypothetical protein Pd630_LPD09171 [Rhodococcus opacus PD630]